MNYVAVDLHKKYSLLCALDEGGRKLKGTRIESPSAEASFDFFELWEIGLGRHGK